MKNIRLQRNERRRHDQPITTHIRTMLFYSILLISFQKQHQINAFIPQPQVFVTESVLQPFSRRRRRRGELNVLTTPESIIEQASTRKLLDDLIDESVRTSARKPIMMQFQPTPYWIWRRWKGTVFAESWPTCIRNMIFALLISFFFRFYPSAKDKLIGFNILWGQLLSVTTFTLTFFLNVSYGLWRKCYELSRRLQGRLNDLGMTLAAHASRTTPASPTEMASFTPGARQILELVSRYIRVFNILTYASFTRSHRPILTPRGMRRLVERGILTPNERIALAEAEIPATQRHNAVFLWIVRVVIEGRQAGHIVGGAGFESEFLEKVHVIRAQVGGIGDELQGRMPLAYAHIVQVLVDVVLWMYPFMACTSGMNTWLGILGCGLLTIFYQGLFDLAKQFLDPYDNENYGNGDDPLCVDTLVAETNAGSIRWMNGFEEMPFSAQRIKEGEMGEYMLPLRGYSVEEITKMKKDKEEKEKREAEERKKEEERDRMEMEEQEKHKKKQQEKLKEEAMMLDLPTTIIDGKNVTISQNMTAKNTSQIMMNALQKMLLKKSVSNVTKPVNATTTTASNITAQVTIPTAKSKVATTNQTQHLKKKEMKTVQDKIEITTNKTIDIVSNVTKTPPINVTSTGIIIPETKTIKTKQKISIPTDQVVLNQTSEEIKAPLEPAKISSGSAIIEVNGGKIIPVNGEKSLVMTSSQTDQTPDTIYGDNIPAPPPPPPIPIEQNQPQDIFDIINESDLYSDLEWFDEVGPDGTEIRLSQLLADEEWEEEREYQEQKQIKKKKTIEDFYQEVSDLIEAAEDELEETEAILKASPGLDADVGEHKKKDKKKDKKHQQEQKQMEVKQVRPPTMETESDADYYDQTKLDGISQLWGASPEDLDMAPPSTVESVEPLTLRVDNIVQLWGGTGDGVTNEKATAGGGGGSHKDDKIRTIENQGIAQLWSEPPTNLDEETQGPREEDDLTINYDLNEFAGLDWFEEVGPDGKEMRLSQMLADEEWEDEQETEQEHILTYEEAVEILEESEEERFETEAILKAAPGASFVEGLDDDELLVEEEGNGIGFNDTLDILEMDNMDIPMEDESSIEISDDDQIIEQGDSIIIDESYDNNDDEQIEADENLDDQASVSEINEENVETNIEDDNKNDEDIEDEEETHL